MAGTFRFVGGPHDGEMVMMGKRPLTADDVLPHYIEVKHHTDGRYVNDAERLRFVWVSHDVE